MKCAYHRLTESDPRQRVEDPLQLVLLLAEVNTAEEGPQVDEGVAGVGVAVRGQRAQHDRVQRRVRLASLAGENRNYAINYTCESHQSNLEARLPNPCDVEHGECVVHDGDRSVSKVTKCPKKSCPQILLLILGLLGLLLGNVAASTGASVCRSFCRKQPGLSSRYWPRKFTLEQKWRQYILFVGTLRTWGYFGPLGAETI